MTNSCVTCPSFISPADVAIHFGKDVGAPACIRHGHIFGKAGTNERTQRKIGEAFAANCRDFNEPRPISGASAVDYLEARVSNPSIEALRISHQARSMNVDANGTFTDPATACSGCKFLIDESQTYRNFGWSSPMCAAKGRLIWANRFVKEARDCDQSVAGATIWDLVEKMDLLPVYADDFGYDIGDWSNSFPDPQEYVTDQEVTADDKSHGIRAWRKIEDPDGFGPPVFLPIFDANAFDAVELLKVPKVGDKESPESYIDHAGLAYKFGVEAMELDETLLLVGAPGTGKTEGYRYISMICGMPFDRFNFTKETQVDSVMGSWLFRDGQTVWKDGRIPIRWRKTGFSCFDEPNRADTVIQEMFLSMFDNSKQVVLEDAAIPVINPDTGETVYLTPPPVTRGAYAFAGLCINPAWNPGNVGTVEFTEALIDRLTTLELGLPPDEIEREILVKRYFADNGKPPPKKVLDTVMAIAGELRSLIAEGSLPVAWGIRSQIKVMRKTPWYPLATCYKMAGADYLEPQTRRQILDVVEAHAH